MVGCWGDRMAEAWAASGERACADGVRACILLGSGAAHPVGLDTDLGLDALCVWERRASAALPLATAKAPSSATPSAERPTRSRSPGSSRAAGGPVRRKGGPRRCRTFSSSLNQVSLLSHPLALSDLGLASPTLD